METFVPCPLVAENAGLIKQMWLKPEVASGGSRAALLVALRCIQGPRLRGPACIILASFTAGQITGWGHNYT